MKVYARTSPNRNGEVINAYQALEMRRDPTCEYQKEFYWLADLAPMSVAPRGEKAYFKFKKGLGRPTGSTSSHKTATHQIAQYILSELSNPVFKIRNNDTEVVMKLDVISAEIEKKLVLEGADKDTKRFIDVVLNLDENSPYVEHLGSQIGVEICVTHKITHRKAEFLEALDYPVIQFRTIPEWYELEKMGLNTNRVSELERRISGAYRAGVYVWCFGKWFDFEKLSKLNGN